MPGVILATHGGASALGATHVAGAVADRLGVPLRVVGVVPLVQPMDYAYGMVYMPDEAEQAAAAEKLSTEVAEQLAHAGRSQLTAVTRTGNAAQEIAAAAREIHADLIVIGLGPHHALDRALGGETALQLVQIASTPVLAVPATATAMPRRGVAAIDFTPTSIHAAELAARLLGSGDTLHLVHVRAAAEQSGRAEEKLEELAAQLRRARDITIDCTVLEGSPARALLDETRQVGGELIALGSHGYGLWKRLTIGSVASKILRLATTCVLVKPIGSLTVPVSVPPAHV